MNNKENENLTALIEKATAGDKNSLETVILSVRDLIFNLSLRMLGNAIARTESTMRFKTTD